MGSRYYRHLFECQGDVIIQSGSVLDDETKQRTSYVYLAGYNNQRLSKKSVQIMDRLENGAVLDLCILGVWTCSAIIGLLHILKTHPTYTVILPYMTPLQRLHLAGGVPTDFGDRRELIYFLDYPYESLRKTGVENIYFLCGNGEPLQEDPDYLTDGYHFTLENKELTRLINGMEGQRIPVLRSGYIKENNWLFYFGTFGTRVLQTRQFMKEYSKASSGRRHTEYQRLQEMLTCFEKRFGEFPYPSIVMYQSPVCDRPSETASLMTGKSYPTGRGCSAAIPVCGENCALRCQHANDYEYMQKHRDKKRNCARMGIWHMGNADLKEYFPQIAAYFRPFINKTRALMLSDGGRRDYWNPQLMRELSGEENIYWITSVEKCVAPETLLEIMSAQGFNRLININENYGFCFSGYLISEQL